ncbi:MAG: hypothetical protein GX303_03325 [Clostridiales bacterium]|nr:hypothetical protein [Clostridiales bacterium]
MDRAVLVGASVSELCKSSLKRYGYRPITFPPYRRLSPPVESHPDLFLFVRGDTLLTFRDYYESCAAPAFGQLLSLHPELDLLLTDELPKETYPDDILMNAAPVGAFLFGRLDKLSPALLALARKEGAKPVHVAQGYARCSVAIVSENAIITADHSIMRAAEKRGIEVLLIRPGHIRLEGVDYGFIGGTGGTDEKNVYFCGDITAHPDFAAIDAFCKRQGKRPIPLSKEPLTDVGSLFFL